MRSLYAIFAGILILAVTGCEDNSHNRYNDVDINVGQSSSQSSSSSSSSSDAGDRHYTQGNNDAPDNGGGNNNGGGTTPTPSSHTINFDSSWTSSITFSVADANGTHSVVVPANDVASYIYEGSTVTISTSVGSPVQVPGTQDYIVTSYPATSGAATFDWEVH
jgi:hypothetical protein